MRFLIGLFHLLSFAPIYVCVWGVFMSFRHHRYRGKTCARVCTACSILLCGRLMLSPLVQMLQNLKPRFGSTDSSKLELISSVESFVYGLPYTIGLVLLILMALKPKEPYP